MRRFIMAVIMSGFLSLMMSCWVTFINLGLAEDFLSRWMTAFQAAWPAAAVGAYFLSPPSARLTEGIMKRLALLKGSPQ